ncbi:MAG: AAA family ATPase, partial [Parabacteroides sp.]|nr:AAA family ATPase [Parabacteroides sp.]
MNLDLKRLPIGVNDFSTLRAKNQIYVDQTDEIFEIAHCCFPTIFIRPNGFGKTLLLTTFESLFSKGVEDFKGLKIEKLWKNKTSPVFKIDFAERVDDDPNQVKSKTIKAIKDFFTQYGFNQYEEEYILFYLEDWLKEQQNRRQFVLLIDNFDAPVLHFPFKSKEYDKTLSFLNHFHANLKGMHDYFRFIFITGIDKKTQYHLDASMNYFVDASWDTMAGLRKEDLVTYFGPYLENAAQQLHLSQETVLERMSNQFGNFYFEDRLNQQFFET